MEQAPSDNRVEKRERLITFTVMPGPVANEFTADEGTREGQPTVWFVRPEGSTSLRMADQPPDSLALFVEETYGDGCFDFYAGHLGTSDQMREWAQELATALNDPETQQTLNSIIERKKKLSEAIAQAQAGIESSIRVIAGKLKQPYSEPKEVWRFTRAEE